jgi:hypothetical protein
MTDKQKSILDGKISPFKQAGYAFIIALVLMLVTKLLPASPYSTTAHIMPWISLCGVILFFTLANTVLSLGQSKYENYWIHSMISYAFLLILGGLAAYLFTGIGIYDAGSVSWLYTVMTLCYLVFLSIVNLIKFFVNFAEKDQNEHRR